MTVRDSVKELSGARLTSTAASTLYQAECAAYDQQRRAAKDPNAYQSPIYPPGTEYIVCQAQAQLMSAVVGLLNESLTEAIKGFYKLRKAYLALEAVMENERDYLKKRSTGSVNSVASNKPGNVGSHGSRPGSANSKAVQNTSTVQAPFQKETVPGKTASKEDDDDDDDFVDAEENSKSKETPAEYMGHINMPAGQDGSIALDNSQKKLDLESSSASGLPSTSDNPANSVPDVVKDFEKLTTNEAGEAETDLSSLSDHPVDRFVLAGSNFCFGMLMLLLSFVPPSFQSLLKIVGFKGDRERGMRMLWQATKFEDIHGAMSGVVLMGYLNGFSSICDIIPSTGEGSYPKERCKALLRIMRTVSPEACCKTF